MRFFQIIFFLFLSANSYGVEHNKSIEDQDSENEYAEKTLILLTQNANYLINSKVKACSRSGLLKEKYVQIHNYQDNCEFMDIAPKLSKQFKRHTHFNNHLQDDDPQTAII